MTEPTIGLALIVRDEEDNLPRLLKSIEGAFDRVVLIDTGSKDATVDIFNTWAVAQDLPLGFHVGHFEWCNDFAAARTYADSKLDTDWHVWADADDEIIGATNLRQLAASAPPDIAALICHYDYARDKAGNCVCSLRRERLVRAGAGSWFGRVHEAQEIQGVSQYVESDVVNWIHHKDPTTTESSDRNRRILTAWLEEDPDDPRALAYMGTEELGQAKPEPAAEYFRRYLGQKTAWDDERAQVHRKLAIACVQLGRYDEAIDTALECLRLHPTWPDSYLSLAEAYIQKGDSSKALAWARQALQIPAPETLVIINPLDYSVQPRVLAGIALGNLGKFEAALEQLERALAIAPDHMLARSMASEFGRAYRDEATAQTWLAAAQQLVGRDEQMKALRLLEDTVPHFVVDHPAIVAMRSRVRARVKGLVAGNQVEPEGGEMGPAELAALPRVAFLADGLLEQVAA